MKLKNLGFTLIENLIVIALIVTATSVGFVNFWNFNKQRLLSAKSLQAKATIDEAHLRAVEGSSLDGSEAYHFGVCFGDQEYTLFATLGDWGTRNQKYDQRLTFTPTIHFAAPDFPELCDGSHYAVIFDPITGETARSGSIMVYDDDTNEERLITVSKSGLVEFGE